MHEIPRSSQCRLDSQPAGAVEFLKQCLIVEFQAAGVGDPDHSRFFVGQSLLTAPAQAYSPAGQRGKTLNAASLPGNGALLPAGSHRRLRLRVSLTC